MADRIHRLPSESGKRKITVKYTPTDQEKFLTEFAKSGNLSRAARIAGVNRQIAAKREVLVGCIECRSGK
jgi:hypothetical protein